MHYAFSAPNSDVRRLDPSPFSANALDQGNLFLIPTTLKRAVESEKERLTNRCMVCRWNFLNIHVINMAALATEKNSVSFKNPTWFNFREGGSKKIPELKIFFSAVR